MTRRKHTARIAEAKAAPTTLLYGAHAVLAALANPRRTCRGLWVTRNALNRHRQALAASPIEPQVTDARRIAARLAPDAVHQGLLLEADPLDEPGLQTLEPSGIVIVLDQVSDPHNVGAVLRSAAAFGARALVMTARNSPPQSGALAKAASGAQEHVPIVRVTNLARALDQLADRGYERIGLDGEAPERLGELAAKAPLALVVGAEGKGLRRLTRERCDHLVRIVTQGPLASLNVSNAVAIALYEISGRGVEKPGRSHC